ncbi:MAG: 30S ribosomal protein S8, partial [Deltaproteobacteria bacterium]
MTMTDPIADMLTRIRNALRVQHESVDVPASRLKLKIAE